MPVLEDVWNWKQIFPIDSQHYCECGQLVRVLSVEDGPAPGFRCDDGIYRFPNGGTCDGKHRIKVDPSRFKSKAECEKMGMWNRETREETWAKDDAAERGKIGQIARADRICELLKDCVAPENHPRFIQHVSDDTPIFITSSGRVEIPELNDRELENCVAIAYQYWIQQFLFNNQNRRQADNWLKLLEVIKPALVFGKDFHGWGQRIEAAWYVVQQERMPIPKNEDWVRIRICDGKIEEVRE